MRGASFRVAGWGTLAGFPFFVAILFVPFPFAWVMIFVAVFALANIYVKALNRVKQR